MLYSERGKIGNCNILWFHQTIHVLGGSGNETGDRHHFTSVPWDHTLERGNKTALNEETMWLRKLWGNTYLVLVQIVGQTADEYFMR